MNDYRSRGYEKQIRDLIRRCEEYGASTGWWVNVILETDLRTGYVHSSTFSHR